MKKSVLMLFGAAMILAAGCCGKVNCIGEFPSDFYAHRGGKAENDENTLQAFRQCISAGINRFETDIRMTEDGKLVVSHDANLKRRTGIDGIVEHMKGRDVLATKTFLGNRIPSVDQVIRLFSRNRTSYVEWELKTSEKGLYPDERIPEYCEAVYKAVSARQPEGVHWVFTSFDERPIRYIKEHYPGAKVGYITAKPVCEETIATALSIGASQLDANVKGTTAEAVAAAHEAGLEVCLWPGTKTAHYLQMKELGADRCCTDIPNLLRLELSQQ